MSVTARMARTHHISGFTFVELLGALLILSVGMLGVAKMQMLSLQGNAFGGRMTTAVALAQDKMESLIHQSTEAWSSVVVTGTESAPTLMGRRYAGCTVQWTITPDAPVTNLATVQVKVLLPDGKRPVDIEAIKRR